jgi:hypothetical protein
VGVVDDATLSPEQLALRPLLHLQRSIAQCFREAHAFYADIPEVATQIRQGAALSRQQLMESTKMLRKVEQTASAVLQMFPDLELAVEEGEPELANAFFNMVRGWVVELRNTVQSTQEINKASMAQIQKIVEQSTLGLQSRNRANAAGIVNAAKFAQLSQRLTDLLRVQQRRLGNGGDDSSQREGSTESEATVTLSADDVLELFVGLFGAQPQSGSASPLKGGIRGVWPGQANGNSPLGPVVEEPRATDSADVWDIDADAEDVVASRRTLNGNVLGLFSSNSPPPPGVGLQSDRVQTLSDSEPQSPLQHSNATSLQPSVIHSACESRTSPHSLSRNHSNADDAFLGQAANAMRIDSDEVTSVLGGAAPSTSSGAGAASSVAFPRAMPALLTNAPNGEAEAVPLEVRIGGSGSGHSESSSAQEQALTMSPQVNVAASKLNEALQKLRQVRVNIKLLRIIHCLHTFIVFLYT